MSVTGEIIAFWLAAATSLVAAAAGLAMLKRLRTRPATQNAPVSASTDSERRVKDAVLEHILDPIVLVDHQAYVLKANKAARALLPALQDGMPLSFALRSPDILEALDEVLRTTMPIETNFSQRVPVERRSSVQIAVIEAGGRDHAQNSSVLLFFRDLTPAWRAERMRADFVVNASHELRTPLASISGFIETLQGPARDDPVARERFLAIMRDQTMRMTRLIDDLLSLAQVEMRAHLPITTDVDLRAVTAQVVHELTPLAQERSVEITLTAPEEELRVTGDRDELQRVVENIIENALKYGESGHRVEVEIRPRDGVEGRTRMLELSVRDYGPGIAPEHLPRLTERFYRVDPTSSRQQGGTGLGLAIVKHIVNRHRGRLAIESETGKGTTVRIALPAVEP